MHITHMTNKMDNNQKLSFKLAYCIDRVLLQQFVVNNSTLRIFKTFSIWVLAELNRRKQQHWPSTSLFVQFVKQIRSETACPSSRSKAVTKNQGHQLLTAVFTHHIILLGTTKVAKRRNKII